MRGSDRRGKAQALWAAGVVFAGALVVLASTVPSGASATRNIQVSWLLPPEPEVAGCRLYWGPISRYADGFTDYPYRQDLRAGEYEAAAGTATYILTGLDRGTTYWVSVTSYDPSGNESDFSNEGKATPAGDPPIAPCQSLPEGYPTAGSGRLVGGWLLLLVSVWTWIHLLRRLSVKQTPRAH